MKNTFLVFNDPSNPESGLREANIQEWDQILKKNRSLLREQRRFFITDAFEDCGEIDCMYIETTKAKYDKWHSQKVYSDRKRKIGEQYGKVSFQFPAPSNEGFFYEDIIGDDFNLEEAVIAECELEALKKKLMQWHPWALELMNLYLSGKKEKSTFIISEKYKVSIRTAKRWKLAFENFVVKFFENF